MAKLLPDQAEGLRRLFVGERRRMVALVGSEQRDHGVASKLAMALAAQRKKVLLLDESLTGGRWYDPFQVAVHYDLSDIMLHGLEIDQALATGGSGVDLIAGGEDAARLESPSMEARIGLVNAFYRLAGQYDVVLVDTLHSEPVKRPSFIWACEDVIVISGGDGHCTTRAYAYIKAMQENGDRRFHLLFEQVDSARAHGLHRSLASVSRRHLQVMPESLGNVPDNDLFEADFYRQLASALLRWPLPENKTGHFPALMRRLLANPGDLRPAMVR
ncbi:MAG: MinD/ParA family protein [Methylobacterium sp.]|nr:MinD/ParA family protein [Methylobacterium sp.]